MIEIDSRTRAYQWIRASIESGELEEGQPLPENFLAREIGVSRTPVREALRLLEQADYVRIIPTKGAFVSEISIQDVKEIYDIRKLIEPFAAASAVFRVPESEIFPIEREWSEISERMEQATWEMVSESDFRFHIMIAKHSTNRRIQEILSLSHLQMRRFQRLSAQLHSDIGDTIAQHIELLDCLKRRDAEKFPAMLLDHIIKSEKNITEVGQVVLKRR